MKVRLWGTVDECRLAAERLMHCPGLVVLSLTYAAPYADRGASVLVCVFVEARLDPPPAVRHATAATGPARTRRRALPAGGSRSVTKS